MAVLRTIGGDGTLFVGEDKIITFEMLRSGVPFDVSGWTPSELLFDVRLHDDSATFVLEKQPTVVGSFNVDRSLNSQRVQVVIESEDWAGFKKEHAYRYSLKRMTDGAETVLYWGPFLPESATAP